VPSVHGASRHDAGASAEAAPHAAEDRSQSHTISVSDEADRRAQGEGARVHSLLSMAAVSAIAEFPRAGRARRRLNRSKRPTRRPPSLDRRVFGSRIVFTGTGSSSPRAIARDRRRRVFWTVPLFPHPRTGMERVSATPAAGDKDASGARQPEVEERPRPPSPPPATARADCNPPLAAAHSTDVSDVARIDGSQTKGDGARAGGDASSCEDNASETGEDESEGTEESASDASERIRRGPDPYAHVLAPWTTSAMIATYRQLVKEEKERKRARKRARERRARCDRASRRARERALSAAARQTQDGQVAEPCQLQTVDMPSPADLLHGPDSEARSPHRGSGAAQGTAAPGDDDDDYEGDEDPYGAVMAMFSDRLNETFSDRPFDRCVCCSGDNTRGWRCCGCSGGRLGRMARGCTFMVPCPDCFPWHVCQEFADFNTLVAWERQLDE
jgi:hypothetical protein